MIWFRTERGTEYSTDFDFFIKEQVLASVSREGFPTLKLICRQTGVIFLREKDVFRREEYDDKTIKNKVRQIHKEIITGLKFKGELVQ
jgi:hypothetical protein